MVKAVGRFMAVRDITVFLLLRTEQRMSTVLYLCEVKNRDLTKLRRDGNGNGNGSVKKQ